MTITDLCSELEEMYFRYGDLEVMYPFDNRYNAIIDRMDMKLNPSVGKIQIVVSGNVLEDVN